MGSLAYVCDLVAWLYTRGEGGMGTSVYSLIGRTFRRTHIRNNRPFILLQVRSWSWVLTLVNSPPSSPPSHTQRENWTAIALSFQYSQLYQASGHGNKNSGKRQTVFLYNSKASVDQSVLRTSKKFTCFHLLSFKPLPPYNWTIFTLNASFHFPDSASVS